MNRKPRYKEVVVDFVDRVHGTGFPEIRPWRPQLAIPVDIVDVLAGTDSSGIASRIENFHLSIIRNIYLILSIPMSNTLISLDKFFAQ